MTSEATLTTNRALAAYYPAGGVGTYCDMRQRHLAGDKAFVGFSGKNIPTMHGAAWAERRRSARLPDFEPQPRNRVQADLGAFVSVAMRLD